MQRQACWEGVRRKEGKGGLPDSARERIATRYYCMGYAGVRALGTEVLAQAQ